MILLSHVIGTYQWGHWAVLVGWLSLEVAINVSLSLQKYGDARFRNDGQRQFVTKRYGVKTSLLELRSTL